MIKKIEWAFYDELQDRLNDDITFWDTSAIRYSFATKQDVFEYCKDLDEFGEGKVLLIRILDDNL